MVFTWQVPDGVEGRIWVGPGVPGPSQSIGDLDGNVLAPIKLDYGRSAQVGQKSGNPTMQEGGFSNSPLDGDRFQPGEEIHVTTRWDRPVKVDPDNPPYVEISMWPTPGWARAEYDHQLSEEQGLHRLVFTYTVHPGDEDTNGIWVGTADGDTPYRGYTSLHNPGGITDYSGRSPNRDWPTDDKEYGVETRNSAPLMRWSGFSSEPAHGDTYQPGEVVEFRVRFDRPVRFDQSTLPYVNSGINNRGPVQAHYNVQRTAAIKVASVLAFTYAVQDGDTDNDQIWVGDNNLKNAASISDYAGNAATGGGLGVSLGHNVGDAGAPSVTGLELTSQPLLGATYQPGEVIEFTLTTDEPISVDSRQANGIADYSGNPVNTMAPSITVAHAVKVPESVSCNDTAWHGPGGAVSSLTIGWSA